MVSIIFEGLEICLCYLDFDLFDLMLCYWYSGDVFKIYMFNVMLVLFFDGECFFIDFVCYYCEWVEDLVLK